MFFFIYFFFKTQFFNNKFIKVNIARDSALQFYITKSISRILYYKTNTESVNS